MKIVIYSTQIIPANPELDAYGGLELISGLQAKYFDEMGHEVHLFACKNSFFSKEDKDEKRCSDRSHLYAVGPPGTNAAVAWKHYWDDPRTQKVLKDADIICDHSWQYYPYAAYNQIKNICHPWHGPYPDFTAKPPFEKMNLIGISFSHSKLLSKLSGLDWRTVHNGIPTYKYTFNNKPIAERERLLWISRIYYPKGAHRAIEIANSLKMPIDIAGGSYGDVPAYTALIKKMCDESPYATFHGEVNFQKKLELYRNAKCVILPIIERIDQQTALQYMGMNTIFEWFEPFGLITPEAGACGTPTIVVPNGGWTETMIHGYNGFFANSNKEFEYYIKQIDNIKPENCRKQAEKFDYKIMGKKYLEIFKEILDGKGW